MDADKTQSTRDPHSWSLNPTDLTITGNVEASDELQILTVTAVTKGEGKTLHFRRVVTDSSRKPFHQFAADEIQFEDYIFLASIAGIAGANVFLDPHSLMVFIDPKMSWQASLRYEMQLRGERSLQLCGHLKLPSDFTHQNPHYLLTAFREAGIFDFNESGDTFLWPDGRRKDGSDALCL